MTEKAKKPDGGSAFPEITTDQEYNDDREHIGPNTYSYGGMSLRDYFAAKAMQGLCADRHHADTQGSPKAMAVLAYECADALIQERDK